MEREPSPIPNRENILKFLYTLVITSTSAHEGTQLGSYDYDKYGLSRLSDKINARFGTSLTSKEISKKTLGYVAKLILTKINRA